MSDLFNEIDDELRQQKLTAFWKENGNAIIGGAVLAVLFTACLSLWRYYDGGRNTADTAALLQSLRSGDIPQITKTAEDLKNPQAALAKFTAAAMLVQQGRSEDAVKLYREIRETSYLDRNWRNLAAVFEASHLLETASPDELHKMLKDATAKKSTWRFSALELDGLVYAREGLNKQAADSFQKIIADADALPDVRARAQTLRDMYAAQ